MIQTKAPRKLIKALINLDCSRSFHNHPNPSIFFQTFWCHLYSTNIYVIVPYIEIFIKSTLIINIVVNAFWLISNIFLKIMWKYVIHSMDLKGFCRHLKMGPRARDALLLLFLEKFGSWSFYSTRIQAFLRCYCAHVPRKTWQSFLALLGQKSGDLLNRKKPDGPRRRYFQCKNSPFRLPFTFFGFAPHCTHKRKQQNGSNYANLFALKE